MATMQFITTGRANSEWTQALSNAHRAFTEVFNVSKALDKDPSMWVKLRTDPVFQAAITTRLHSIARPDWRCRGATSSDVDRRAALVATDLLMCIGNLKDGMIGLAEAVFVGSKYRGIVGERRNIAIAGGPVQSWWVPTKLKDLGFLRVIQKDRQWMVWDSIQQQYLPWEDREFYVKTIFDDSEEYLGFGRGLIEAAAFYWWLKGEALVQGIEFIRRWAQGTDVVKIDASAIGNEAKDSATALDTLLDKVEKGRERHLIGIDSRDSIEHYEASGTGWQALMEFLQYLDDAITRLFAGSLRATGGGGQSATGARAQAETEAEQAEGMIQYEREKIADDLTRDLIGLLWRVNVNAIRAMGLGDAKPPYFEIGGGSTSDPMDMSLVLQRAHYAGIDLDAADVYRKLGLEQPVPGRPVIKGASATAAPSMFGSAN